jgi:ParB-like chromosome segregation protein Spo0J
MATAKKTSTKKTTTKKAEGKKQSTPKPKKLSKKQRAERRYNEDGPAELKSLLNSIMEVPVSQLQTHPANPRVGDVSAIAESLAENGQYRPIIVQRGTGFILGGNHTYLAARKLGWDTIHAIYLDVNDERAKRIMLADNKTAELGGYDERMLAELLASLEDPDVGTGFAPDEVESLIEMTTKDIEESLKELSEQDPLNEGDVDLDNVVISAEKEGEDEQGSRKRGLEWLKERDAERRKREKQERENPRSPEEVQRDSDPWLEDPASVGIGAINAPEKFSSSNEWGIPDLLPDMFMQSDEVPDNLATWAGSATRHINDPDQWWLYNFGIDSTSGMIDKSKCIISFFVFDDYFEEWWNDPGLYVARALNTGIKYICSVDFSPETIRAYDIYQLYRQRWLERFFQESGLKLLPHISWPHQDPEFIDDFVIPTLPVDDISTIILQYQTFDPAEAVGGLAQARKELDHVLKEIDPEHIVLYGGRPAREWFRNDVKPKAKVTYLNTRVEKLSAAQKQRKKEGKDPAKVKRKL